MLFSENRLWINNLDLEFPVLHGSDDDGWRYGERNALRRSNRDEGKREKQREKRGPPTMSNIAGLSTPGSASLNVGWLTGVEAGGGWKRERAARGCNGGRSTDPSASLHPRLSATLIFLHGPRSIIPRHIRPLSSPFPSCFLSASETELLYPPRSVSAVGEQGAAFRLWRYPCRRALLIALSEFITEALVRGLPEFRY